MILLAIITFLALVLRTYQIGETFVFSGEFGHNLLAIKNTLGSGTIPLVGPPTSHPWLSFGPLYYWITYPVLVLGNWHPLSSGVIGVLIGTLIIPINYIFISNIFGKKVAIISSLLIAISPTWIMYSRGARFFFLVTPFFYPLFWSLHKLLEGSKDYLWITALSFGLMLNFHYSTVILTPVILLIIIFRYKLLKTGDYLKTLLILLITNLPLIIHDASSGFTMLGKFVLWIPYRFAGLAEARSIADDAKTFSRFSGQFFLQDNYLWEIIAIILLLVTLNVVTKSKAHFLLSLIFFTGLVAFFIHGGSPVHYLLPIFPIPILLVSIAFEGIRKNYARDSLVLLLFVMIISNINFSRFEPRLYGKKSHHSRSSNSNCQSNRQRRKG